MELFYNIIIGNISKNHTNIGIIDKLLVLQREKRVITAAASRELCM